MSFFKAVDDDGMSASDTILIKAKLNWTKVTDPAGFPRGNHSAAVFKNKIWVVGAYEKSDILSSQDGITWTKHEIQKPFYPNAHFFQVTVHAGKGWSWEDNQVWLSSDLSTWGKSTASAPFVGRLAPTIRRIES
ncbi:MAG: hypothetical protein M3Y08_01665 [Fibrobacterota bacterium]|nr:hypothetical protein [Fibrobacterota bacterium]